jgi:hypothetical protein
MRDKIRFEVRRGAPATAGAPTFCWAIVFYLVACFFTAPAGFSQAGSDASLAQRRATRLRHGINLSEWFAQVYDQKGYVKEHFET